MAALCRRVAGRSGGIVMYRLALLCVFTLAPAAVAQDRQKGGRQEDQIDRLARRLERDARELREEVISHFRKRPGFKDMEGHAREIERLAARIHKLADRDARPRQ